MSEVVIKGLKELAMKLETLPAKLEKNIMRSALRAGATVVAKEAKNNVVKVSGELAKTIRTSSNSKGKLIEANAVVGDRKNKKGWYATFVEFGTAPHIIKAKDAKRLRFRTSDGKWHSLFSVEHKGARAKPFMRPAFDTKGEEAVKAVAERIRERLTEQGINTYAPESTTV